MYMPYSPVESESEREIADREIVDLCMTYEEVVGDECGGVCVLNRDRGQVYPHDKIIKFSIMDERIKYPHFPA